MPSVPKIRTFRESIKIQERRMDQKFAILIKLRDGLRCRRCGRQYHLTDNFKIPSGCQNSHYIGRSKRHTRWSYENCYVHCGGCHRYLEHNPEEFRAWVLNHGGHTPASLDFLRIKSNVPFRSDRTFIEMWIDQELLKLLPDNDRLNYKCLEPLYMELGL